MKTRQGWLLGTFIALAACSSGPPKPETGAPVVFETVGVANDDVSVRAYNFSEKPLAGYDLLIRYRDASGAVMKTPTGKDYVRWSVSGMKYKAQPRAWTPLTFTRMSVPSGAAKAEILAASTTAVDADGLTLEKNPLWSLGDVSGWPGK